MANATFTIDYVATNPSEKTVFDVFSESFNDQFESGNFTGIAVTDNRANNETEGLWEYSVNGGSSWLPLPTTDLSENNAFTLNTEADTKLRFVANNDYRSAPGGLTVRLIDDSIPVVNAQPGFDVSSNDENTPLSQEAVDLNTKTTLGLVSLLRDAQERYFTSDENGEQPISVRGKQIFEGRFPGWTILAATTVDDENQILWERPNGNYHLWFLDENWNWEDSKGNFTSTSAEALEVEENFQLDLNGDREFGNFYSLLESGEQAVQLVNQVLDQEETDGVLLVKDALQNLSVMYVEPLRFDLDSLSSSSPSALDSDLSSSVLNLPDLQLAEINRNGEQIFQGRFPGWTMLAAATVDGENQVLWERPTGNYHLWFLDENWNWQASNGDFAVDSLEILELEKDFEIDLNDDLEIGYGAIDKPNRNVRLFSDDRDLLFVDGNTPGNDSDDVPIKVRGQQLFQGRFPGWTTLAAETINGENQILWERPNGNYHIWFLDEDWNWKESEGDVSVDSPQALELESDFDYDLNEDGIVFGQGADTIAGSDGDDRLIGGGGNDSINGLRGNDTLKGGFDNDTLSGGEGNDLLEGSDGADFLDGNSGADSLDGGEGNDELFGENSNDTLMGGLGDDTMNGGNGVDSLDGGEGNDELFGENSNDTLMGGLGDDAMNGGNGADSLDGGEGNDELFGLAGDDTLIGGLGDDSLRGGENADSLEGGEGADELLGGSNNDLLNGGAGNDTLEGRLDDDTLIGSAGNDILTGGSGSDRFDFNSLGEGVDTITDFLQSDDLIAVSTAFGGGLTAGSITPSQFEVGTAASSGDVRFIYSTSSGELLFDADGNGSVQATLIATLSSTPELSASNLSVFDPASTVA